jgi:mercuric ion transport protein
MTIKDEKLGTSSQRGPMLMAVGGLLGALAASSCCIFPLVLFGLGVSGAWIGNFTQLAPYQPCFIAVTLVFLVGGTDRRGLPVPRAQMPRQAQATRQRRKVDRH